jgi:predicted RNase H-like nuclease (RuvC/YqgF family)
MKKIAVLILVLLSCPCFAVKALYPGDTVKGKVIDETYYCYSEEEQRRLLEQVKTLEEQLKALEKKNEESQHLRDALSMKDATIRILQDQLDFLKKSFDKALNREGEMTEEVKKRDRAITRAERKGDVKALFYGAAAFFLGRR